MRSFELQELQGTEAFNSLYKHLSEKKIDRHYNELFEISVKRFWDAFFPLSKKQKTKYELVGSDWKWAKINSFIRLYSKEKIFIKSGKTIYLAEKGKQYLLQAEEDIKKKREEEDMSLALQMAEKQIERLWKEKEQIYKDRQTEREMFLSILSQEQKEAIKPMLKLINES